MAGKVGASRGTVIADDRGSDTSGLIDPAFFPELKPEPLYNAANNLRKMGTGLKEAGEAVNAAWRGLQAPGCYEAPEQEQVYALQQPTVKDTAAMHDDFFEAARLIGALANDYKAIQPDLTALATEASAFRIKALAGWPTSEEYPNKDYTGDGPGGPATEESYVPYSRSHKAHEINDQLVNRLHDIKARIAAAEVTCADGLRKIDPVLGVPPPASGSYGNLNDPNGNSLASDYANAAGPWGFPTKLKNEECASRAYYGLFANPIDSAFDAIAGLAAGYDHRTGQYSDAARKKAWENMASINLSLLIVGLFGSDGDPGNLPPEIKQWIREHQAIGAQAINDTVGYDPNPAAGQSHWHAWDENVWDMAGRAAWGVGGLALAAAAPLLGVTRAFGVSLVAGLSELAITVTDWVTLGGVSLCRLGFGGLGKLIIRAAGGSERIAADFGLVVDSQGRLFLDMGDGNAAQVSRIVGTDGGVITLKDFAVEAKVGGAGPYTIVLEDGRTLTLAQRPGGSVLLEGPRPEVAGEAEATGRLGAEAPATSERSAVGVDPPSSSGEARRPSHPVEQTETTALAGAEERATSIGHTPPAPADEVAHAESPRQTHGVRQGVVLPEDYEPLQLHRTNEAGTIETRGLPNNAVLECERDPAGETLRSKYRVVKGGSYSRADSGADFAKVDASERKAFGTTQDMATAKTTYPNQKFAAGHLSTIRVSGNAASRILADTYDLDQVFGGSHAGASDVVDQLREAARANGGQHSRSHLDGLDSAARAQYSRILDEEAALNFMPQDSKINSGAYRSKFEDLVIELSNNGTIEYVDCTVEKVGLADDPIPRGLVVTYRTSTGSTGRLYFPNIRD